MDAEWQFLQTLAEMNGPIVCKSVRLQDEFRIVLRSSPAWVGTTDDQRIETEHELRYFYPRYYPTLPLEGYFIRPILHVNVDPVNGFVCLWKTYRPTQTIVDAILITRAIMSWKTANLDPEHRMQQVKDLPTLTMPAMSIPESCLPLMSHRSHRQRLSTDLPNHKLEESDLAFSDIK